MGLEHTLTVGLSGLGPSHRVMPETFLCPRSGTQAQPGPIRQQEIPRPGEDRPQQQAGRPDPGEAAGLEGRHSSCRWLLRCPRGVQHRLVRVRPGA